MKKKIFFEKRDQGRGGYSTIQEGIVNSRWAKGGNVATRGGRMALGILKEWFHFIGVAGLDSISTLATYLVYIDLWEISVQCILFLFYPSCSSGPFFPLITISTLKSTPLLDFFDCLSLLL